MGGAAISKEQQVQVDSALAMKLEQEVKKQEQEFKKAQMLLKPLAKRSSSGNHVAAGAKGKVADGKVTTLPVKDLTKDPCYRPKIIREEGSALVKTKLQSTTSTAAPSETSSVASGC